jgi:hypothetical protein
MDMMAKNTFMDANSAMPMPQTIHPTSAPFALASALNTNATKLNIVPLLKKKRAHPSILHPANTEVKSGVVTVITPTVDIIIAATNISTERDAKLVAAMPRVSVTSSSTNVEEKKSMSPLLTTMISPASHNLLDLRSGGSRKTSKKNAANPIGAFPRKSVEKYCLMASRAMTSMGLDVDSAKPGETRLSIDSPPLTAENMRLVKMAESDVMRSQWI